VENFQDGNKLNLFHFPISFLNMLDSLGKFQAQKNSLVK